MFLHAGLAGLIRRWRWSMLKLRIQETERGVASSALPPSATTRALVGVWHRHPPGHAADCHQNYSDTWAGRRERDKGKRRGIINNFRWKLICATQSDLSCLENRKAAECRSSERKYFFCAFAKSSVINRTANASCAPSTVSRRSSATASERRRRGEENFCFLLRWAEFRIRMKTEE